MSHGNSSSQRGVTTQRICAELGLAPSTLDNWVKKGLCKPSLVEQRGHRYQRYWTLHDVATVRAVKHLRASGLSVQRIEKVREELRTKWASGLGEMVVLWDGHEVLAVDGLNGVMAVLEQSGQLIFEEVLQVVSVPFAKWLDEADGWAEDVNPVSIAAKRDRRLSAQERAARIEASAHLLRPPPV